MNSGKLFVACRRSIAALPPIAVDEIVPVGDQVAERAPLVAERDAAVHAARGLPFEHGLRVRQIDFAPVVDPLRRPARRMLLALNFDEPGGFAHMSDDNAEVESLASDVRSHSVLFAVHYAPTSSENSASVLRPPPLRRQHALVVARHHLDEQRATAFDQSSRMRAASWLPVYCTCRVDQALARARGPRASSSGSRSTISRLQRGAEAAGRVEHVGDAAAHAGGEVPAGAAEHDDAAAGHVLAAVIADAFDDRERAAVADGEPLAGEAADVRLAAGRAVQRDVADDDVVLGDERRLPRRIDDQPCRRTAPCRRSRSNRLRASA